MLRERQREPTYCPARLPEGPGPPLSSLWPVSLCGQAQARRPAYLLTSGSMRVRVPKHLAAVFRQLVAAFGSGRERTLEINHPASSCIPHLCPVGDQSASFIFMGSFIYFKLFLILMLDIWPKLDPSTGECKEACDLSLPPPSCPLRPGRRKPLPPLPIFLLLGLVESVVVQSLSHI